MNQHPTLKTKIDQILDFIHRNKMNPEGVIVRSPWLGSAILGLTNYTDTFMKRNTLIVLPTVAFESLEQYKHFCKKQICGFRNMSWHVGGEVIADIPEEYLLFSDDCITVCPCANGSVGNQPPIKTTTLLVSHPENLLRYVNPKEWFYLHQSLDTWLTVEKILNRAPSVEEMVFVRKCASIDPYADYSDDITVWRGNNNNLKEIKASLETNPGLQMLYDKFARVK